MRFHKQKFRHDPENGVYGDCARTALASLMGFEPEEVPHFGQLAFIDGKIDNDEFHRLYKEWLSRHNLSSFCIPFGRETSLDDLLHTVGNLNPNIHYLLIGTSGNRVNHVVICCNSEIVWDPSLDNSGIIGPCEDGHYWVEVLVPSFIERK